MVTNNLATALGFLVMKAIKSAEFSNIFDENLEHEIRYAKIILNTGEVIELYNFNADFFENYYKQI